jgi:hypothetical protein
VQYLLPPSSLTCSPFTLEESKMNEYYQGMKLVDIITNCWSMGKNPTETVKEADHHGFIITEDYVTSAFHRMSAVFTAFLAKRTDRQTARYSH